MLGLWYTEKLKQENISIKEINNFGFVTAYVRNGLLAQLLQLPNHSDFCVRSFVFQRCDWFVCNWLVYNWYTSLTF